MSPLPRSLLRGRLFACFSTSCATPAIPVSELELGFMEPTYLQAAQDATKGGIVIVYTSTTFAFAQSIAFCYSSYSVSASATALASVGTSQATAFAQTASIASSQASAVAISSAYVRSPERSSRCVASMCCQLEQLMTCPLDT